LLHRFVSGWGRSVSQIQTESEPVYKTADIRGRTRERHLSRYNGKRLRISRTVASERGLLHRFVAGWGRSAPRKSKLNQNQYTKPQIFRWRPRRHLSRYNGKWLRILRNSEAAGAVRSAFEMHVTRSQRLRIAPRIVVSWRRHGGAWGGEWAGRTAAQVRRSRTKKMPCTLVFVRITFQNEIRHLRCHRGHPLCRRFSRHLRLSTRDAACKTAVATSADSPNPLCHRQIECMRQVWSLAGVSFYVKATACAAGKVDCQPVYG